MVHFRGRVFCKFRDFELQMYFRPFVEVSKKVFFLIISFYPTLRKACEIPNRRGAIFRFRGKSNKNMKKNHPIHRKKICNFYIFLKKHQNSMKITDFYEGYSDAPQKLWFLTTLCKSVLNSDRILLFIPDARQLLMQKSYESPIFVKKIPRVTRRLSKIWVIFTDRECGISAAKNG